jgi:purine-binding chemotaxis protein CheW
MNQDVIQKESFKGSSGSIGNRLSDKYLTFKLGNEEYAVPILTVQRIIQMQPITPVPKTPVFVRGVINLRGKIIPILELRTKFGMSSIEDTETTCIVVLQFLVNGEEFTMGAVIDQVSEVLFIEENQIQETPSFGSDIDTEFIMAVAKIQERVVMLLDINAILTPKEISAISSIS